MATEPKKESKNIYQRMSAITTELSTVAKNLNVGYGRNAYKAAGEADILMAVKPLESKHGVYSYPVSRKILMTEFLDRESIDSNGNVKTRVDVFLRIETTYKFVNVDNPDESIECIAYGDGVDSQDKAPGKAITYSDKYCLMKAYKIITGVDPDQDTSKDTYKRGNQRQQGAPPSQGNAPSSKQITQEQALELRDMIATLGGDDAYLEQFSAGYGFADIGVFDELAYLKAKTQLQDWIDEMRPNSDKTISKDEATELKARLMKADTDIASFCKFFKVESIDSIKESQLSEIWKAVEKKEIAKAKKDAAEGKKPDVVRLDDLFNGSVGTKDDTEEK
jgi:hypothetical protein